MAGLIKREDVDTVRERAQIDEIVGEHVTLRPAGVGSLKGLCPFHDEKSPSFHVRPALGRWHCFGCSEGGDVISFVQKIDGLGFAEAVEFLAGRYGVQLRYEEGSGRRSGVDLNSRQRLLEAHRVAAEYYQEQLGTPAAAAARQFLTERGFDRSVAEQFGLGFAPNSWDALLRHLRGRGFTEPELTASGLMSQGGRGIYDRFRGRLLWPIRDVTGETIGFGARKIFEEDQGPKYLNTPETPIYKKSQVLYGIDLAKREIARSGKVVVVEGYTDVMAMHLSGEATAVATCGTAFGTDHVRIIRRLMGDTDRTAGILNSSTKQSRGSQVIFTFDGDAAGNKAALRTFAEDDRFNLQPYVASDPNGLDPCDLRQQGGSAAVKALVDSKVPLYEFVIKTAIQSFDLNSVEGRVGALRAAAPEVARIRDRAVRPGYARELAGWLGLPEDQVLAEVENAGRTARNPRSGQGASGPSGGRPGGSVPEAATAGGGQVRHRANQTSNDPVVRLEQQTIEVVLQFPHTVPPDLFDALPQDAFTVPALRAVHEAVRAAGGMRQAQAMSPDAWLRQVLEQTVEPVSEVVNQLAVQPVAADSEAVLVDYARGLITSISDRVLTRQIAELRGRLDRTDATTQAGQAEMRDLLAALQSMEEQRHTLRNN